MKEERPPEVTQHNSPPSHPPTYSQQFLVSLKFWLSFALSKFYPKFYLTKIFDLQVVFCDFKYLLIFCLMWQVGVCTCG